MNQFVLKEYPNAETGSAVTTKYLNFLEKEYRSDLKKMLFATSLCSDDVNISTDFRKVLARPFTMGGLGGLPYSGLTGMVAFAHHIPDGGDGFIFYGPHIGISDDGELGKMRRPGQSRSTNSCGALMLGLERLQQQREVYVPVNSELDYQQILLEQTVMPYKQRILEAPNAKKEITEVFYEEINKKIQLLVKMSKKEFPCERVFLLGGIIINTSPEFNDMVDVRNFQVINTNEMEDGSFDISILETPAFRDL